ncbi:hypothetical protein MTR67_051307 [Solanum verrucosum]|uniref:Uncharacterized protein n=1 Tax=Solanum verrucosum TaxID=315347 RepID=A0AAF0V430_SOLVR|nr:hypothetical protein MTR67_051307 [Solanum verrucosum]
MFFWGNGIRDGNGAGRMWGGWGGFKAIQGGASLRLCGVGGMWGGLKVSHVDLVELDILDFDVILDFETPTLESIPIVNEFPTVFPDDLSSISFEWKIDFGIDLLLDTQPISISPYRIQVNPKEIERNYPRHLPASDIQNFLGLAGYYRRFVKEFSSIASLLTTLTQKKKDQMVLWYIVMLHGLVLVVF